MMKIRNEKTRTTRELKRDDPRAECKFNQELTSIFLVPNAAIPVTLVGIHSRGQKIPIKIQKV